jgi:tetratricopeptide (TPR) repeat protein
VQQEGSHRLVRTVAGQWGFTPLARVEDMLEDDLAWARETGSLGVETKTTMRRALVRFQRGDAEGGERLLARGLTSCSELGLSVWAASFVGCWVWGLTDDPEAAEAWLQESYDTLEAAGRLNVLSTVATLFAECRYRQQRYDEAERLLAVAAEAGADDDFVTQVRLRAGKAKLLARHGAAADAESMARAAVSLADETEFVDLRGDSLLALGDVLALDGRTADAEAAHRSALALWEAKGNAMAADRARRRLAEPVRTE